MTSGRRQGQVAKSNLLDRLGRVPGLKGRRALDKHNVRDLLGACFRFGVAEGITEEQVRNCWPCCVLCSCESGEARGCTATDDVMHFMRLDTRLAPPPPPNCAIQTSASNLTPSQHAGCQDSAGLPQAPRHRAGWSSGRHLEALLKHGAGQRHSPCAEAGSVRAAVEPASLVGVGENVEADLSRGVLAYAIVGDTKQARRKPQ